MQSIYKEIFLNTIITTTKSQIKCRNFISLSLKHDYNYHKSQKRVIKVDRYIFSSFKYRYKISSFKFQYMSDTLFMKF